MSAAPRRWKTCVATIAFAFAASLLSIAERPTPADNLDRVAVRGNVHPFANPANDVGRADSSRILHGVSVHFKRTAAQQAELDQLLADQQDRLSPDYHQWLTPDQFAARFGAAPQLIQSTAQWLASQGLTLDEISRSRDRISFSGTVSQVEGALHARIHRHQVGSELHIAIANSSDPEVPAAFASSILGFRNLHDFRPKPRCIKKPAPSSHLRQHELSGPR